MTFNAFRKKALAALFLSLMGFGFRAQAQEFDYSAQLFPRQMEKLSRGLCGVAVSDTEAYLSWRLLATDAADVAFDLWRQDGESYVKLNSEPLTQGTNFTDRAYRSDAAATYWVTVCEAGKTDKPAAEKQKSGKKSSDESAVEPGSRFTLAANSVGKNYISIPLQTPERHTPGDCSVGDLDGDGQYEIVVKQEQTPRDNSGGGMTGETMLEAYRMDGTFLWRINLGKNIREGAHYTQFMVYDLDGDGKAEVVCKTADGTTDGLGQVLGDSTADWRQKAPNRPASELPQARRSRDSRQPGQARPGSDGRRPDGQGPQGQDNRRPDQAQAQPDGRQPQANEADEAKARERLAYWHQRMESYMLRGEETPQALRDSFMAEARELNLFKYMQREQGNRGGGHILSGPEYLTVFSGETGAALKTVDYVPSRVPDGKLNPSADELKAVWGDGNGNRSDRYLACVAYLDGRRPSVVMCRGYYTRSVLAAWDWRDGELSLRWVFDSDDSAHPENRIFRGQGNHNLSVADVDGDGFDEIIYGNMVVDHDGTGLYSTRIGHADAMHVGDLDPERPGLEVFNSQEPVGAYGMNFRNAGTGEIYWNVPTDSAAVSHETKQQGPGRAVAFDIDPRYPGSECWVFGGGISGLYTCKGEKISDRTPRTCNFAVWWDADPQRELLDRNVISKYNWETDQVETLFEAEGCTSNNGTKATPALSADLFGDWREEVMLRTRDNKELRIYFTTIPCDTRRVTLMHDPVYRLGIAWQNVAYNIPPHVSYYMK